jgi:hypothetical protein
VNVAIFRDAAPCEWTFQRMAAVCLFLAQQISDPEDGGDTFLRNVSSHMDYTEDGNIHNYHCENLKS